MKTLKLVSLLGLTVLTGCSLSPRKDSTSRLRLFITGPDRNFVSSRLLATQTSAFSCYAVNVIGAGIVDGSGRAIDPEHLQALLAESSFCTQPGITSSPVVAGQSADVELIVPSGTRRLVQVMGIDDPANEVCNRSEPVGKISDSHASYYELGRVVVDLFSDRSVEIKNVYSTLSNVEQLRRKMNCKGAVQFAPTGLAATPGNALVSLTWTPVGHAGAVTYSIKRSSVSGSGYGLLASGHPTASYTDSTVTNGSTYYYVVTATNAGGESGDSNEVSATPSVPTPTVGFTAPAANAWINSAQQSAFTVSGTCSEAGESVLITGAASGWTTCAAGGWSLALDFSAATDGTVTITADHSSAGGLLQAPAASRAFLKDTLAPTMSSILIDSGATTTTNSAVSLTLGSSGASEMYITNVSGCSSGGSWETFSSSKNGWSHGVTSGTATVYVKFRNSAGNESSCVSDTIQHVALFNFNWQFNSSTDYMFNTSKIEFTAGVCRLTPSDQVDDDNSVSGFGGGSILGVIWDGSKLLLDHSGAPTNRTQLDPSWAPAHSNLTGYYPLDGSIGNIAHNTLISGLVGPSGTVSNSNGSGMAYGLARLQQGVYFDGADDVINFGNQFNYTTQSFSFSLWFKLASLATTQTLLQSGSVGTNGYALKVTASGEIAFYTSQAGASQLSSTASQVVASNQWYHLAITRSAQSVKIYINGVDRTLTSGTHYDPVAPSAFTLGWVGSGSGGMLDDFASWDLALTGSDVYSIYSRQAPIYSGMFVSRVMDALSAGQTWSKISWTPELPFFKELPDSGQNESTSEYPSLVGSAGAQHDNDLMSGLIGLWHLNETSGSSFLDASGNGHTGTALGAMGMGKPGVLDKSAGFDSNSGIKVAASAANHPTTHLTVSAWVNIRSSAAPQMLVTAMYSFGGYSLSLCTANTLCFEIYAATNLSSVQISGLKMNEWIHVVGSYDGSNLKLYTNGELGSTLPVSGNITYQSTTNPLCLGLASGVSNCAAASSFQGAMDEVSIWQRPLHPAEILQLYRRGANRIKYQVRVCTTSSCADDSNGLNWKGPDGTRGTYFSELNNKNGSGNVNNTAPGLMFSNFTNPVGTSQYFQYRTILESDDVSTNCNSTWCSPELRSVAVDPAHFDQSAPTLTGLIGTSFRDLSTINESLGAAGCLGGIGYNLGKGSSAATAIWYWWNGSTWSLSNGSSAESNLASDLNTNLVSFPSGPDTLYLKAFLKSSGTNACELNDVSVTGFR